MQELLRISGSKGLKSLSFSVLIIFISVFAGMKISLGADNFCKSDKAEALLKKHVPLDKYSIISRRTVGDLCEIIVDSDGKLLPFYIFGDSVVSGELWKEQHNLSADFIKNLNRKNFLNLRSRIDSLVGFSYSPSKIKSSRVIYMFTEPLCPYCHEAGKLIYQLSNKYGFVVKILFYSVHGREGQEKSVEAICRNINSKGKFNLEEYNRLEWREKKIAPVNKCKKGENLVSEVEKLSPVLRIDGVPLIYNDLGDSVEGFDPEEIEKLVKDK